MRKKIIFMPALCLAVAAGLFSQGITATNNSITIYANLPEKAPVFYFIFSSSPLMDAGKNVLAEVNLKDLKQKESRDLLVIKVRGQTTDGKNGFTYFFGKDAKTPWNNGTDFDWNAWASYSPDLWDNISIAYEPSVQNTGKSCRITDAVIIRSRSDLLNTLKKTSFANKKPISVKVPDIDIFPLKNGIYPILNLAETMDEFKTVYYEIAGSLLREAYADLGQTDGLKYAPGGSSWCSEFSAFPFVRNNFIAANMITKDIGAGFFYDYFIKNGKIYPLRDVALWSDEKKEKNITQGAILCTGGHTFIFVNWAHDAEGAVTGMQRISGNNSMDEISIVRNHAIKTVEYDPEWAGLSGTEEEKFDKANFFGVLDFGRFKADP